METWRAVQGRAETETYNISIDLHITVNCTVTAQVLLAMPGQQQSLSTV